MNLFDFIGAQNGMQSLGGLSSLSTNDGAGGFRAMLDMAAKHRVPDIGSVAKEMMTNAPEGVTQLFKGPWNFGQ